MEYNFSDRSDINMESRTTSVYSKLTENFAASIHHCTTKAGNHAKLPINKIVHLNIHEHNRKKN